MKRNLLALSCLLALCKVSAAENLTTYYEVQQVLVKAANAILGDRKGDFSYPGEPTADALVETTGVPRELREVAPHIYFISGCRPHSCDEKSASLVDLDDGRLLVSGLRNFHCRAGSKGTGPSTECDGQPRLTIFVYQTKPAVAQRLSQEEQLKIIRQWANQFGYSLEEVEVIPSP